jgi:breast cancer 2 susceptibility protein
MNSIECQHTPFATKSSYDSNPNVKSKSTDGTHTLQESWLEFMPQNKETDKSKVNQHQAPHSCRHSFSESRMVKTLLSSIEDKLENVTPCFAATNSMAKQNECMQHHLDAQIGMTTPSQHCDFQSKLARKTYVTPGSSGGYGTNCDSTCYLSLSEASRKGIMISDVSQCRQFSVHEVTININSENANQLRFNRITHLPESLRSEESNDTSDLLGSMTDYRNQLKMLNCDVLKMPVVWLTNHVRWIIWKLAATERRFAPFLAGKYLSFDAVTVQLKHRYDKEIREGARSAVRRLLNRDISASCMFILCVARIRLLESSALGVDDVGETGLSSSRRDHTYLLELTDGWYALPAKPDTHLCKFILNGTIQVGTKLLISNSSMTGFDEGIDPLDRSFDSFYTHKSPVIHIFINSSRLARWNSKLGIVPHTQVNEHEGLLLTKRISDVYDCGGRIPLIDLKVIKRYPLSYLDRQTCSSGTISRVLTEREEQNRIEEYNKQKQSLIDEVSEEVLAECEKVRLQNQIETFFFIQSTVLNHRCVGGR